MRKRNNGVLCLLAALAIFGFPASAPAAEGPGAGGEVTVKEGKAGTVRRDTLFDKFVAGGLVMYPLALCSMLMMGYSLERMMNLRRDRVMPDGLAERISALWKDGKIREVETLCAGSGTVFGRIMLQIAKHRGGDAAKLRGLAEDAGSREMRLQLQKAYPLAIIAALAPLLGLLGTVSGMIDAFDTVALAGSVVNPAMFADSISKTMVTTGTGLMVAIPSLAVYHLTKSRIMVFSVQIEEALSGMLESWEPEAGPAEEAVHAH